MSSEIKFEVAIMGYIRELEDQYTFVVPDGIKKLILEYYPKKINYIGKFLEANAGHMIRIQRDQLSFDGYRAAKLDEPLPTLLEKGNTSMIYRWRAVIEATCGGSLDAVIFGVVSNRCKKFHAYPYIDLLDGYGISMHARHVYHGLANQLFVDYEAFKPHDIVCMEYEISDVNKCKLSFYNESKDNEFMYAIDLPNDIKEITSWYPVFSKPNSDGLIKIIPY